MTMSDAAWEKFVHECEEEFGIKATASELAGNGSDWDDWEDDSNSEWRPGDAPWNAPGMSVSDFI